MREKKTKVEKSRHGFFAGDPPFVIAHRGARAFAPENTLVSFARAFADGADIIECDLRLTKDGEVVILHDATLSRTTSGAGYLRDTTLAELKKFDAGYGFSPDGGKSFPFRGQGITVPTLEEMLTAFPQMRFYLEVKEASEELVRKTLEIVRKLGRENAVLVQSNNRAAADMIARQVRKTGAKVALCASFRDTACAILKLHLGTKYDAFCVPQRWPNGKKISIPLPTKSFNAHAAKHGKYVIVWTVNDEKEINRLLDYGADGIITDDPGKLRALIRKRRPSP